MHVYVRMRRHVCTLLLLVKKLDIFLPGFATNFHGFSNIVRTFCAPELSNLAHTQSPLFDLLDRISLLESNKHNQWSWKLVDTFKHKFSLQEEIILNRYGEF